MVDDPGEFALWSWVILIAAGILWRWLFGDENVLYLALGVVGVGVCVASYLRSRKRRRRSLERE